MKKRILLIVLVFIFGFSIIACSDIHGKSREQGKNLGEKEEDTIVILDLLGREVPIPKNSSRFVNVGVGCLRLYTYVAPLEKLVGVEQNEKEEKIGVPYSTLNSDIFINLPTIGQGGPKGVVDPEQILMVKPDVIFNTYATDIDAADELQSKTGIPVVVLNYGEIDLFNQDLYESLLLIGRVTGEEERAEEVVKLLKGYHDDLVSRTKDVKDSPSVYVGALGSKGVQGIESTRGDYTLLNVLNVKNVVDDTGVKGSVKIDKEQLLNWDPEYIFIDINGYHLVKEDYKRNPKLYDNLSAVKENRVYSQFPYNKLNTNIETAIVDAYYIGTVLYQERFSDILIKEKADEIYISFLGKPFYETMVEDYQDLGIIRLE